MHRGFLIGSIISVIGFMVLGLVYLRFDDSYVKGYPQSAYGFKVTDDFAKARTAALTANPDGLAAFTKSYPGPILDVNNQPIWSNSGSGPAWTCGPP